jgi:CrcB protein
LPNWINPSLAFVFLGGGIGSVLRYILYLIMHNNFNSSFPFSTFMVNFVGSFALGISFGIIPNYDQSSMKPFLGFGIFGGFTTFSSFSLESIRLFQNGESFTALLYIFLTIFVCFLGTSIGLYLGTKY